MHRSKKKGMGESIPDLAVIVEPGDTDQYRHPSAVLFGKSPARRDGDAAAALQNHASVLLASIKSLYGRTLGVLTSDAGVASSHYYSVPFRTLIDANSCLGTVHQPVVVIRLGRRAVGDGE